MITNNNFEKNKYHFFFIFILSLNYLFPLIVFKEITLFYHDVLDIGVVYYHILGKYFSGEKESIELFLNGNLKIEYLRHWLKPYTQIYTIFNTELAYWITEILIKITAYVSVFVLAKKISKNIFTSSLAGALYASINPGFIEGFGTAIFPYIIYLSLYKRKINFKHIILIIFFGFNSDLVRDIFLLPVLFAIIYLINKNIDKHKIIHIFKLMFLFYLPMILSSSNLIYALLFDGPFHRQEFVRSGVSYFDNTLNFLKGIVGLSLTKSWFFFFKLPQFIFLAPLVFLSFLQKNTVIKKILALYILLHFLIFFINLPFINDLKNNSTGLIKSFNFEWVRVYLPAIAIVLFIYNLKILVKFKKYIIFSSLISLIFFQINSSFVPLFKKNMQGTEYRNLYTFSGYYLYDDYKKIKNIVKNKRVISVGLDPMVAVMNNIKTIDGYHTLYPLKYKKEFRKIIQEELNNTENLKKYYDNWGSRVYAFTADPENIRLNFSEAKSLGADFVISKYSLNDKNLSILCDGCSKYFKLYKIN